MRPYKYTLLDQVSVIKHQTTPTQSCDLASRFDLDNKDSWRLLINQPYKKILNEENIWLRTEN